jgi:hypothetical protein
MDVLGMPPITFLRRKRLCDVHAALLTGGPATMMIKAVAIEHGFVESADSLASTKSCSARSRRRP